MTEAQYYSMRLLSPYQGTVQVVEVPGFRAISADGLSWQVQLQGRAPARRSLPRGASRAAAAGRGTTAFSVHGVWRADGSGNLIETERTRPFLTALHDMPALPFALADRLELWLLDARERLPLALLASTLAHHAPPAAAASVWRPAFNDDESFIAPSLMPAAAGGVQSIPIPHRAILERCVRAAAGARPQTQWFRRAADGGGMGCRTHGLEADLFDRRLEPDWFPELLVREEWDNEREAFLVRDYHDWQAAGLLTHGGLSRATRDRLERAACHQPRKLYRVRRLLPEVINPDLLKVALVQAAMQGVATTG